MPFSDFSDVNFLRCWALSNLRPLESSLNLEDAGVPVAVLTLGDPKAAPSA